MHSVLYRQSIPPAMAIIVAQVTRGAYWLEPVQAFSEGLPSYIARSTLWRAEVAEGYALDVSTGLTRIRHRPRMSGRAS